ncbi:MAG TPA: isoaspartyl peptidase/L-asparaginase [Polyangia bacterium]|jgi:beta-aspartyl-peptidase (threonine type)|nr:isoaspartyl peptidase/L-asparaginase [Polyangia bacterium]
MITFKSPIEPAIIVHGGAGDRPPDGPEAEAARRGCEEAVAVGLTVLSAGGSALDAVQAAVRQLEDDPQFNAGVGSCLTREGTVEMDAAIMCGEGLRIGAVAAVAGVRNPILLARRVLDAGKHAMLVGGGAVAFAREVGVDLVPPDFHITDKARQQLAVELARRQLAAAAGSPGSGTVGAVALDGFGHVASATSTGGMTGKRVGRVGDSPIFGAGTYADDEAGAASATGHGERIMQVLLTKTAVDHLRAGASAAQAAAAAIATMFTRTGGIGGIILIDRQGRLGQAWNSRSMAWAASI